MDMDTQGLLKSTKKKKRENNNNDKNDDDDNVCLGHSLIIVGEPRQSEGELR